MASQKKRETFLPLPDHQTLGIILNSMGIGVFTVDLERRIEEKISKPPEDWALWPKKSSLACRLKH